MAEALRERLARQLIEADKPLLPRLNRNRYLRMADTIIANYILCEPDQMGNVGEGIKLFKRAV